MVFVGAAILPHGALPFDGDPLSESEACRQRYRKLPSDMADKFSKLYRGMCDAGRAVAAMDPDVIVLHSPHGIRLRSQVGVHLNDSAAGTAEWNGCWGEFKVEVGLAAQLSKSLVDHLRGNGVPAEGISCFSNVTCPLMWGEVIPIWYILRAVKREVKFILLSQSTEPWPVSSVSEDRLSVGRSLASFVSGLSERVALVISGDLSHVYSSDYGDTLYQPAKGWTLQSDHMAALDMERAFRGWAVSADDFQSAFKEKHIKLPAQTDSWYADSALPWLQQAATLQPIAYSCGLVGFILLQAFLQLLAEKDVRVGSEVTACEAPTYYGLMAVVFKIIKSS